MNRFDFGNRKVGAATMLGGALALGGATIGCDKVLKGLGNAQAPSAELLGVDLVDNPSAMKISSDHQPNFICRLK